MATTTLTVSRKDSTREALTHGAATFGGAVLQAVLGGQHTLTGLQGDQFVTGLVGNALTYLIGETPTGWRKNAKKYWPFLTAIATAAEPYVKAGDSLHAITTSAALIPVLHLAAGLKNVIVPNEKTIVAAINAPATVSPGAEAYTAPPASTPKAAVDPATVTGALPFTAPAATATDAS